MGLPTVEQLTGAIAAQVEADDVEVAGPAAQALALVGQLVGDRAAELPDPIGLQACVDVGAELHYRRKIRHGIVQLGDPEGGVQAVKVNRDPAAVAHPLLRPWIGPGIA